MKHEQDRDALIRLLYVYGDDAYSCDMVLCCTVRHVRCITHRLHRCVTLAHLSPISQECTAAVAVSNPSSDSHSIQC